MRARNLLAAAIVAWPAAVPFAPGAAAREDPVRTLRFDFAQGAQGWSGGFADYLAGWESEYGLAFGEAPLPAELGAAGTGLRISGSNLSDDLFMYLAARADGFEPGAPYRLRFRVRLASNAPRGAAGIGGAPGEAVWVKAGATSFQPQVVDDHGYMEINLSKGDQAVSGADAQVIGDVAVRTDPDAPLYRWKVLRSRRPHVAAADSQGSLWLLVGTDSGFEGTTTLYYGRISVRAARSRRRGG